MKQSWVRLGVALAALLGGVFALAAPAQAAAPGDALTPTSGQRIVTTPVNAAAVGWGPWDYYTVEIPNLDGRLEQFWRSGNTVYHRWQVTPGGSWSQPQSLGCCERNPSSPAVERNSDGRLEVFIPGTNNKIYHRWQNCAGCGWNGSWQALPGDGTAASNLWAGHNADGTLDVFVRGTTGLLHHNKQQLNNAWTGWIGLGKPAQVSQLESHPIVDYPLPGRMRVLVYASDGHVWSRLQSSPSSLGWDPWVMVA